MCCDLCPQYESCDELGELRRECCPQCPDYEECMEEEEEE